MNIRGAVDQYDRKTETYIVAYLDILGVTSRMQLQNTSQVEPLNKLYNLYTFVMELVEENKGIKKLEGIEFKIFSDNVIIAKKLSANPSEQILEIESVFNWVSHFQASAVGDGVGWLVRGGITIGDFFINETIVWGNALLRAYELENSIAIYPRVIIDTAILSKISNQKILSDYLRTDVDGMYFLNYMNIWHFAGEVVAGGFEKMKIEARNADGQYSDRVYQKLYWHMKYINSELNRKAERKDKKYRLRLESQT